MRAPDQRCPVLEIELKLLLDPADLARVGRSRAVSLARRSRGRTVTLDTIYYDTPDKLLWRAGVTLRVRHAGARWIQTVKGAGEEIGGLHRREEFEWPVPDGEVNLVLLAGTPFAKLFAGAKVRSALAPAFATVFRRRSIELELPGGSTAEFCLDLGEIHAGGASATICEAEIELTQGDPVALLVFAGELLADIPFRIGTRSKAERGYALGGLKAGSAAQPVRAEPVRIAAAADAQAAFAAIVQSVAEQVHANERGFLEEGDPEYLHQLRVGLRRLRVALALPRDQDWEKLSRPLRDDLRGLARQLGEARNWDVFTTEMLQPMSAHCGAKPLAGLRSRAAHRRTAALAAARAAVRGPGYTRLWLELARLMALRRGGAAAEQRAGEFAAEAITRCFRRVSERAADASGAAKLHQLRIAAKKLRYVCEFFGDLYPRKKVRRFLASLGAMQDALGAINDAAIGGALVDKADEGARPLPGFARGLAMGWIAAGDARARRGVDKLIRAPLAAGAFWK